MIKLLSEYKHDVNNTRGNRVVKVDDEYADIVDVLDHKHVPPTSTKRRSVQFLIDVEGRQGSKRENCILGESMHI